MLAIEETISGRNINSRSWIHCNVWIYEKKVLNIRNILSELFEYNKLIKIYTDNLASKTTIENGEINNKLRHIDIKFHFNKDNIKNKKVILEYIKTENMLADPLTKDFNGSKMSIFTDQIFDKKTFWSEREC